MKTTKKEFENLIIYLQKEEVSDKIYLKDPPEAFIKFPDGDLPVKLEYARCDKNTIYFGLHVKRE